jgi:methionyl-tRNA synthetase
MTMKRRLITSALPYVNNVPHLGNLIQVLSGDVFARFCRLRDYETLYVCGTDEYGTATETKALEEGVSPRELCDRFNALHEDIYRWFNISFDRFGRTSTPKQTEIVQDIFRRLDAAGYISEKTTEQLYCDSCGRFLADRYVHGVCPRCGYAEARGDQCEHCGKLLEPTELKEPRCATCSSTPKPKSTTHLYIDLPAIKEKLDAWMKEASVKGFWAHNAIQMTQAWIRDGLRERCITRDLKWGIPVPREGFTDKVFYVWFDAPIGYVSITASLTGDWKSWWMNPENVELFQFIGKDNIPFHTVVFPSSLLGDGRDWTMLHHMSSTEFLNYEGEKFSKSKGVGVFGTDALESGIPADVWRFYVYYNRPEKSDVNFTWADFQEKVNGELIGNLGNLVNRSLTFVDRYFDGMVPEAAVDPAFSAQAKKHEESIGAFLERAELRDAFREIFSFSSMANKAFQDGEPWKTRLSDPAKAKSLIRGLCIVLKDLSIMLQPYIPASAEKLAGFFGLKIGKGGLSWADMGKDEGLGKIGKPEVLFSKLEDDAVEAFKARFAGSQKDRAVANAAPAAEKKEASAAKEPLKAKEEPKPLPFTDLPVAERFRKIIRLKVAKIVKVERHPKADKLYIETLDDGSGTERVIVSGLVPHYREEELLGKHIILVDNLKAAKLRGTESRGMLLAASMELPEGGEKVEALEAPWAEPGTQVLLEGDDSPAAPLEEIDIDSFFSVPLRSESGDVKVGSLRLTAAGRALQTAIVKNGEIG